MMIVIVHYQRVLMLEVVCCCAVVDDIFELDKNGTVKRRPLGKCILQFFCFFVLPANSLFQ